MRRAVLSGRFGWGGEHRPHLTLSGHLRSEVKNWEEGIMTLCMNLTFVRRKQGQGRKQGKEKTIYQQ